MANGPKRRLLTSEFRMSFAKLIKPEAYTPPGSTIAKGEVKYSLECIIPHDGLKVFKEFDEATGKPVEIDIRKLLVALANEKWPGVDLKKMAAENKHLWPFKDGDKVAATLTAKAEAKQKKRNYDHYKGMTVFKIDALEKFPPTLTYRDVVDGKSTVIALNRGSDSDMGKAAQLFVGGNYAIAEVTATADDSPMGPYLKLYVNSVRCTRTGDRLGGGNSLMDRFDGIEGGSSDHNPAAGLDDQIPY